MTEREMFEAWAYSKKWNIFRVRDMGMDRYVDDFVDGAWHGWQSSASRGGYKLVPVELSSDVIKNLDDRFMEVALKDDEDYRDIYKALIEATP